MNDIPIRAALVRQSEAAERNATTETGLWALSILLGIVLMVWAMIGGDQAIPRLLALGRLWPLVAVWALALAWRGRAVAHARLEIARAAAMVAMSDLPREKSTISPE